MSCEDNLVLVHWLSDLINVSSRAPCCSVHEVRHTRFTCAPWRRSAAASADTCTDKVLVLAIDFVFVFVLIYDLSSCHWEDWSVVFCREGGRTEGRVGARQGGVLEERRRDGGRNSLKSQSEVWVAADRQRAAERARQIGKLIRVRAVKLREILNSLKFYRDVCKTFGHLIFAQILDFWGLFFYSLGFLFIFCQYLDD